MQVAEILSDITSLRVCGHYEGLTLVSVNKAIAGTSLLDTGDASTENATAGADKAQRFKKDNLRKAKELVELHYEVKSRHVNGQVDEELRQAREGVERVLRELT
ncbi:hypothetical protein N7448_010792 [Penicillium atrosanguineum]|uniref:Uncharacterized protein n=1 Tax=Penicillium atrosanguineum TaxID=1132637 RepID=A0A9W9PMJ5_9EURO|nr:Carboxylic acid transporter [Penicillium atrosanguineum]KAJ5119085.1 hypothetical protein N7526_010722 [Penicillium atrosanguineum]KAJ5120123.1 hypothetical protein N7448_010792 [Penicillium atrosanguineum]KAJ5297121.1 Carboxylic acid transporter [Penicillium atrosanguineum]KAJ5299880.1 hypothetical protein N7476_011437 [Penicillium atrosanguineum]